MSDSSAPSGRIASLDLIRGVAIPAILLMNVMWMAAPEMAYWVPAWRPDSGPIDHVVFSIQSLFVESRFMTMFALLFGAGLAIQADRLAARGLKPRPWLARRLAWLLVFGLIHGFLIWHGDILTLYAVTGLIVMACVGWPVRRLVRVGAVLILIGQLPLAGAFFGSLATGENILAMPDLPYTLAELAALRAEWTRLGWFGANATAFLEVIVSIPLMLGWHTAGVMLIGMALYRSGFFTDPLAWRRALPWACAGLLLAAGILILRYRLGPRTSAAYATLGVMMLPGLAMGIGYASLLVRAAIRENRLTRALERAGRSAFTLYLGQSVVTVGIFVFLVPSLWGTLGRGPLWIYVAIAAVVQVVLADHGRREGNRAPMERLWRHLAYRRMPLR